MNYRYNTGEFVFCKFRGKCDIGRIEFCGITCGMKWYDVHIVGSKRLQRKYEYELNPIVKN